MIDYNSFLLFLSQISGHKKAKVVVQGSIIFIETDSETENWNLSTKILRADTKKAQSHLGSYLPGGAFKWQGKGAYLRMDQDTKSLYLEQKITSSKKYLPFKSLMQDFASVASEWKEILETCSQDE